MTKRISLIIILVLHFFCSLSPFLAQDKIDDENGFISTYNNASSISADNQTTLQTTQKLISKKSSPRLAILKGTITDSKTTKILEADIELIDNLENEAIGSYKSNNVTGKYLIALPSGTNYGITITKDGYLFQSKNVNFPDTTSFMEIIENFRLCKLEIGSSTTLNNVFFEYENDTLTQESIPELEKIALLLEENKHLKIEILAFTDNKESKESNQVLATNRAKAVVDFLISKGIDNKRLTHKGFSFDSSFSYNNIEIDKNSNNTTLLNITEI